MILAMIPKNIVLLLPYILYAIYHNPLPFLLDFSNMRDMEVLIPVCFPHYLSDFTNSFFSIHAYTVITPSTLQKNKGSPHLPFLVVITLLFSWIISINDLI